MDHIQRKTDSNLNVDEEALSTVSKQECDLEWKQFIQKELEKVESQENNEGKEDPEKASSAKSEFTLNSFIEQIPLEKLINSAIKFFTKETEKEKTEVESTKTEPKKIKVEPEKQTRERGVYTNQEYDMNSLLIELKEKIKRRNQQRDLKHVEAEKARRESKEKCMEDFKKVPSPLTALASNQWHDLILKLYELKKQRKRK